MMGMHTHMPAAAKSFTPGQIALAIFTLYALALGVVLFLMAPWTQRVELPLYGHDTIRLTPIGAIVVGLGALFSAFGSWAISRGLFQNGGAAVLLGCAAPMITGSPVALILSLPTLVGAIAAGALRANERG
jgi:hypothetical protein